MNKTYWYFTVQYSKFSEYANPTDSFVIESEDEFFPAYDAEQKAQKSKKNTCVRDSHDFWAVIYNCPISKVQFEKFQSNKKKLKYD